MNDYYPTNDVERSGGMMKLILILLAAAGFIWVTGLFGVRSGLSHGETKHGAEAAMVRTCIEKNGADSLWYNPETEHYAECVQIPEIMGWGWRIVKQIEGFFEEITSFTEEDFTATQAENYNLNAGYMEVAK